MLVSKGAACSAINCSNNRGKNPELSFFTFPKDEERCKQWIQNMRRADFTVKDAKYCRLCSHHFEDIQFVNSNRKRLVWNAVPTLFDIPNAPEKDEDKLAQQEMCGMAYPLRTKRRKIIATESNRTAVDKKEKVKLLPEVPEFKIKQEPVSEDQQNDETKISHEEEPFVPPIKIKEEMIVGETNNNGEESEVLEPTFVDVQVNLLCKEAALEDEMGFEELPEGMDISFDASKDNSFTSTEDIQDPLESTQAMHEEQTTSVTRTSLNGLDDMPLLKRRPVVPVKPKSPSTSSRREVLVSKILTTVARNKKIIPLSPITKSEPVSVVSKTVEENSEEWHVLQRLSWVRQQKDKVEEHIRAVRQEKQLKERMEDNHSALCLCIKCKNGVKRSSFQKPTAQPDSYYITKAKLCSKCNKIFKNETSYLKHMVNCGTSQTATVGVKADVPYVCSSCGEVFDNSSKQLKHMAVCSPKVMMAIACASVNGSVDSKHSCGLCGEKFQDEASQLKHLKNCFSNKPYECYSCGRNFHDPEMRAIHVRRMHEKERVCFQCGMKYKTEKELETHIKLQCCRKIITFPCLYCNRRFYNEKSRNEHTGSHLKKKFFSCTFCVEKFYYQSELIRHIGVHKEREKEKLVINSSSCQKSLDLDSAYECSLCGERFDTETLKVKHILNCFRKKQYLCLVCGKHFEDRESRAVHVVMDHKDASEDVCLQCGLKCVNLDILKQHQELQCSLEGDPQDVTSPIKEEEEEQKYVCPVCRKEFQTETELDDHTAIHVDEAVTSPIKEEEEQKYVCPVCRKEFQMETELDDHTAIHVEEVVTSPIKEEEEQKYVCPLCRKEFQTETELDDHTAIHVEEAMNIFPDGDVQEPPTMVNEDVKVGSTVYQCTLCGMSFISHQELLLHIHNKHNKYLCFYPTCGITFNNVDSGLQHFNAVHSVKPLNKKELEESQSEIKIAKVEGNVQYPVGLTTDSSSKNTVTYTAKRRGRPAKKTITLLSVAKLAPNKPEINPKTETTSRNAAQGTSGLIYKVRSEKPIILRRKRVIKNGDEKPAKPLKILAEKTVVYDRCPPYSCEVCGMKFYLLTDRAKHILTHVGEKKFSCSTCGKMFTLRENLERHLTTHMTSDNDKDKGPPFLCPICGKCFLTLISRSEHVRQHPCMNCSYCGRTFTTKRNLMDHLVGVHSNRIPQNNQLDTSSIELKKSTPNVKTYMYNRGKGQS